ncbi:MAG TPA: hypothetical protein VF070_19580 [Streptosporangiaceae bacterium]
MAGTSAVQNPDSAKYPAQAALLTLVSAAHDHDTPAVSPVRRKRASWGRNCGTARTAATSGSKLKMARIDDPSVARKEAPQRQSMAATGEDSCEYSLLSAIYEIFYARGRD